MITAPRPARRWARSTGPVGPMTALSAARTVGRARLAVVVVAVAVLAASCSNGSDGSVGPTTSTSTSTTPSVTPVAPSSGCEGGSVGPAPELIEVTVDGRDRSATVYVPDEPRGDGEPYPVVLSFHGVSGNPAVQQATDGLIEQADEEGFVVVHPEGLEVGLNDQVTGISGWDPDGSEVDEPAFVSAVLDDLEARVCIDTARVQATGFSAGGNIALVVACALPERIAAVAPVAAAYQPGQCAGAPPVPTLAFHGLDDLVVPFDGRDTEEAGTLVAVGDALDEQARRNGCVGDPETAEISPRVSSRTWSGCDAPTVLVELDEHGHAWPGHPLPFERDLLVELFAGSGSQPPNPLMVAIGAEPEAMADNVLLTNDDVDATEMLLAFFEEVTPRAP